MKCELFVNFSLGVVTFSLANSKSILAVESIAEMLLLMAAGMFDSMGI